MDQVAMPASFGEVDRKPLVDDDDKDLRKNKDEELVSIILDGNMEARDTLWERYFVEIYNFVDHLIDDNRVDRHEYAQSGIFHALEILERYDSSKGAFRPWLFTVVKNKVFSQCRKRTIKVVSFDGEPAADSLLANAPSHSPSPDSLMTDEETTEIVEQAIDTLPPRQKLVVMLLFFEELTPSEVAELLGITPNGVASTLHYAKQNLTRYRSPLGTSLEDCRK
jgi:RNA polymerase sigma-70 factor, ECF subfamily